MKNLIPILLLLALTLPVIAQQAVTVRVCTYKLLNFNTEIPQLRRDAMWHVFDRIKANILVLHGIEGAGANSAFFLMLIDGEYPYRPAPFFDGPGTDNTMYYDTTKIELIGSDTMQTSPRYVDEYTVVVKGTTDTIRILSADLKEGDTQDDQDQRLAAAFRIRERNAMASYNIHYLLAGDLNVSSSSEYAYTRLTYIGGLSGEVVDPIAREGDWHGNQNFSDLHTHSTRLREFDGGAGGGLNQRFDFLLVSGSLLSKIHFVPGSYTTLGNDGKHLFDSVNHQPNTAVDEPTAQALHDASDHLPVYLDLTFTKPTSNVEEQKRLPVEIDLSFSKQR